MTKHEVLTGLRVTLAFALATLWSQAASAQSITGIAAQIGITPESVVIADLDGTSASLVLGHLEEAAALCQNLAAQHLAVDAAGVSVTALSESLLNDPGNEELIPQHQAALAALQVAKEQVVELREALFEVAVAGISPEKVAMIVVCRQGAPYRVQAGFRATQQTDNQWKAIERALRAEGRAIRRGESLDETHADLLAEVRSDQVVIEAQLHLQLNFDLMQQIFDQFEQ